MPASSADRQGKNICNSPPKDLYQYKQKNARDQMTAGALSGVDMTHLERFYSAFFPVPTMIQNTTSAITETAYQIIWLPPKKSII